VIEKATRYSRLGRSLALPEPRVTASSRRENDSSGLGNRDVRGTVGAVVLDGIVFDQSPGAKTDGINTHTGVVLNEVV
jgi:hypothetical protein